MKSFTIILILLTFSIDCISQDSLSSQKNSSIIDSTKNSQDDIYTVVETTPQFPGGQDSLIEFLNTHIEYPKSAYENGKQGVVYISFVVEKNGTISNTKTIRGAYQAPELDEEALRVINLMPIWTPGFTNSKPVRVQYTIPIRFTLEGRGKKK